MRLLFIFMISAGLCVSCDQPDSLNTTNLREAVDSLMREARGFSGVVLVADKGDAVFHKAYGYENFASDKAMDTTSIFELASVSKQFTAMIVMILEHEGKLSFDDSVEKFFPQFPYPGITVRHLLHHTSGLPDYQQIMDQYWDKSRVANNDDNIEYLVRFKPSKSFEPGEKFEYSNTGYMLLATIAERSSGTDFIALCREKIFSPLGMNSTDIRTIAEKSALPNMAWGHLYVEEKARFVRADSFPAFNYTVWLGNRKGPGRVSSTSGDMLRWDRALYTDRLLPKKKILAAFEPARLNDGSASLYGFGWRLGEDTGGRVVSHNGDNPGYRTFIIRYIELDRTLLLLNNNEYPAVDTLVFNISTLLTGDQLAN